MSVPLPLPAPALSRGEVTCTGGAFLLKQKTAWDKATVVFLERRLHKGAGAWLLAGKSCMWPPLLPPSLTLSHTQLCFPLPPLGASRPFKAQLSAGHTRRLPTPTAAVR